MNSAYDASGELEILHTFPFVSAGGVGYLYFPESMDPFGPVWREVGKCCSPACCGNRRATTQDVSVNLFRLPKTTDQQQTTKHVVAPATAARRRWLGVIPWAKARAPVAAAAAA